MNINKLMAGTTLAAILAAAPMMAGAQDLGTQPGAQDSAPTTGMDNQMPEPKPNATDRDIGDRNIGDSAELGLEGAPDIATQISDIESLGEVTNVKIVDLGESGQGQSPIGSPAGLDTEAQATLQDDLQSSGEITGSVGAGSGPDVGSAESGSTGMTDDESAFSGGSTAGSNDPTAGESDQLAAGSGMDQGADDSLTGPDDAGSAQSGSAGLPNDGSAFSGETTGGSDDRTATGSDQLAAGSGAGQGSDDSLTGDSDQSAFTGERSGFGAEASEEELADLRQAIEGNSALAGALEERQIDFEDVVAVEVIGENDVVVYVDEG